MLSRFKIFSIDGFIARGLRVAALTFAATGLSEWAMQMAAFFGVVETFGVKRMVKLMQKGSKKNDKGSSKQRRRGH